MRLDEIRIQASRAARQRINGKLFDLSRVMDLSDFEPFYKHIEIKQAGGENLINVIIKLGQPPGIGTLQFGDEPKTQDEMDYELLKAEAKALAEKLLAALSGSIKIEDSEITETPGSVILFMVSDGFIERPSYDSLLGFR